jgi:hypothetical protein
MDTLGLYGNPRIFLNLVRALSLSYVKEKSTSLYFLIALEKLIKVVKINLRSGDRDQINLVCKTYLKTCFKVNFSLLLMYMQGSVGQV